MVSNFSQKQALKKDILQLQLLKHWRVLNKCEKDIYDVLLDELDGMELLVFSNNINDQITHYKEEVLLCLKRIEHDKNQRRK